MNPVWPGTNASRRTGGNGTATSPASGTIACDTMIAATPSRASAHPGNRSSVPTMIIDQPSPNSTAKTRISWPPPPGNPPGNTHASAFGTIDPMIHAGFSMNCCTKIRMSPRTAKCRAIRGSDHPRSRRESANSTIPAPMRKKKPGAQRCVTYRVRNDSQSG